MNKDIVAGLGEIGKPILKLLSKDGVIVGFDLNHGLMDERKFEKYKKLKTSFLHITIPVTNQVHQRCSKTLQKIPTRMYCYS